MVLAHLVLVDPVNAHGDGDDERVILTRPDLDPPKTPKPLYEINV